MDLKDRFYKFVEIKETENCWLWHGTKGERGYGVITVKGKQKKSHIVSYYLHTGEWPSTGMCVLHTCDNPPCVNPNHLYLGTRKTNAADKLERQRCVSGLNWKLPIERFELSIIRNYNNTECWFWKSCINSGGYGQISVDKKLIAAHIFSYRHFKSEIPTGMVVMHTCDNPPCVNPDHLILGTRKDNSDDKVYKLRHTFGENHVHSKITNEQAIKIRQDYALGKPPSIIAEKYNLSKGAVRDIISGHNFANITGGKDISHQYGSDEWKQTISKAEKGKSFSPEHLANLRAANAKRRGKPSWNKGMHLSDEWKRKLSESHIGKMSGVAADPIAEQERRKKISDARKEYWRNKKE